MNSILELKLLGLPLPVERRISCSPNMSVFDLKKLVAIIFQFDFHRQIKIEAGNHLTEFPTNEIAIETPLASFFEKNQTITYHYIGSQEWKVSIELIDQSEKQERFIECLDGVGQAILHPQMTLQLYEDVLEHVSSGQELETFLVNGEGLQMIGTSVHTFDVAMANDILSAVFIVENEHHSHTDAESKGAAISEIDFSDDAQLRNAELVEFYTEIIGMTDEQASYHVLYEMSVNNIIEILKISGLSSNEIEAALRGALVLEDDVYQLVQNDFDNLNALPPRKDIFTEEDEERLIKVEELFFSTIEEFDLTVEEFLEMEPEKMSDIEQRFFEQLQQLDKQLLS